MTNAFTSRIRRPQCVFFPVLLAVLFLFPVAPLAAGSIGSKLVISDGSGALQTGLGLFDEKVQLTWVQPVSGSTAASLLSATASVPLGRWIFDLAVTRQFPLENYDWTEVRGGAGYVFLTDDMAWQPENDILFDAAQADGPVVPLLMAGLDGGYARHQLRLEEDSFLNQGEVAVWCAWLPGRFFLRCDARFFVYDEKTAAFEAPFTPSFDSHHEPPPDLITGFAFSDIISLPDVACDFIGAYSAGSALTFYLTLAWSHQAEPAADEPAAAVATALGAGWKLGDLELTAFWQLTRASSWSHAVSFGFVWHDLW